MILTGVPRVPGRYLLARFVVMDLRERPKQRRLIKRRLASDRGYRARRYSPMDVCVGAED